MAHYRFEDMGDNQNTQAKLFMSYLL